jgi:CDP-diacylglycerol pyrophosphatase
MRLNRWVLLGLLIAPIDCRAADPSALWKIVNGQCVPHQEAAHDPAPCSLVDLALGVEKGFAALKDIRGVAQYLLIPTARISGIEDPAILAPGATNYWHAAWQARHFVEERLHTTLPRDAISLAINSAYGRTQDQLHIHIDCIRPDIHEAVARNLDHVVSGWTPFPTPLAGHNYRSIRIAQVTLDKTDPFQLLADADPKTITEMGMHTLVLIGASYQDGTEGFVLLDDHIDLVAGDTASGEELQDHSCAIAPK